MSPRASIFGTDAAADAPLDLADFSPAPTKKVPVRPDPTLLRTVSEAENFPSREPARAETAVDEPPRLRRRRTGRNAQINIKAKRETIDALYTISDREGWVLGETLEYALDALAARLNKPTGNEPPSS